MKILMITPCLPYPLFSGGQVRSFNIIKQLSKNHEITLFSFIRNEEEKAFVPELEKYCRGVHVFMRKKAFTLKNILMSGVTTMPFILHVYNHPKIKEAIKEELEKRAYNLIHVETFYLMHNLPNTAIPVILFEQNIEHDVYHRIAQYFQPSLLRPFLLYDVFKMRKWEEYFWKKASAVVCMSEAEKAFMGDNAFVCGNGVDTIFYKLLARKKDFRILFLGNFKWFQNLDAARFLLTEIWPRIQDRLPEAKLFVVGKHIPENLKNRQTAGVVFDENAPDDTRKIYKEADILLAPIRASGGTSFKVLEAMATGLPVVTTPLVEETLFARDGEQLLVVPEDDPEGFAKKTVELLQNNLLYQRIAKNARMLVEEKYDWKIIVRQLEEVYTSITHNTR